jgi:hypothetical protein
MKIALCLYGYYNNKADKNAGDKGYNYIQEKIIKQAEAIGAEVDIFVHSWDIENSNTIINKFNPAIYEIEKQIDFNDIAKEAGIDEVKINEGFDRDATMYRTCTINASLSFFYSRSKSLRLAIDYANENEFKYDCVIACRFDLGQRSTWHRGYNVSLMNLDLNLDMDYIYSAMWVQTNAGYADQWFFSNQDNMEKLADMYDMSLNDYFHIGSDYEKMLTTDWIDSNVSSEMSNERFNATDGAVTMKYPRWQMINNHIIHKWHFIETGLYEKSKFIGDKR